MLETTWFYAPPSAFQGMRVKLPDDEAHHLSNVLRGGAGEEIVVVDGEGGWYRVALDQVGKSGAAGRVMEERRDVGEPSYRLTIGIGLIKSRSRFETFLEKAVELGVSRIIPLSTDRTEKQTIRRDRVSRVLRAAMKQTRRSRLPAVAEITEVADVLAVDDGGRRLLCHAPQEDVEPLSRHLSPEPGAGVTVLIGPEGGFSTRELEQARQLGWKMASLGRGRLRTETAGIAAAAAVQVLLES